jgi:hypothetical protein
LRSKLGVYCGEVDEISQPLFPMGMKTPISIVHPVRDCVLLRRSNARRTAPTEAVCTIAALSTVLT